MRRCLMLPVRLSAARVIDGRGDGALVAPFVWAGMIASAVRSAMAFVFAAFGQYSTEARRRWL
jgi:hypothetical protein